MSSPAAPWDHHLTMVQPVFDELRRLRPAPGMARSADDRVVAGVAGGVGRHLGVDPTVVRLILGVLTIANGSGAVLYLVGWTLLPAPPVAAVVPPKPVAPPLGAAGLTAMLTGGSIAIAALGSAVALLGGFFSSLSPLGAVGVIVAIVGAFVVPTAILAWVKLRRRDVAALLEGSGWAVNHRLRIERPTAEQFTVRPSLPKGAATRGRDASDGPLPAVLWTLAVVLVLAAVAWQFRDSIATALGSDEAVPTAPEAAAPAEAPAAP